MTGSEVLRYFHDRQDAIMRLVHEIVEIESPSFNVDQSRAVADWFENVLRQISLDVELTRVAEEDYGDHLLVRAFQTSGPNTLVLGHTDTVHPIGSNQKNPTRIAGDKFYGCGFFDMKANIVLMLEALRFFAGSDVEPAGEITVILSCDEGVGSFTGRPIIETEAARTERCLIFEPSSNGRVKTGRKGTGMYKLHAHGIAAHAGLEPEKGANAISELSRQVQKVHDIADPQFGTTVNVTTINGGTTLNVIPENAVCEIDVRFSHAAEASRIEKALRSLTPVDPRITLEVKGGINRPPLERTDAVINLYEQARQLAASFDYALGETQVGGASDGNFVAAMGVTVLDGLGIAGGGAHTLEEHILVSDIANRAALATLLLMK